MQTKKRQDVAIEDRWNVEALFPSFDDWKKEFGTTKVNGEGPTWPELLAFKGKLGENAETLKKALNLSFSTYRNLSKFYTYAHLRHDEDIAYDPHKAAYNHAVAAFHEFNQETSWMEPELMSLSDDKVKEYLSSPILEDYRFHLEKVFRLRKHTLSPDNERLVALAGKALMTPYKAFSAINDADFKFGSVRDSKGKARPLTHALYSLYLHEKDRTLRENAFKSLHGRYCEYENTLCELLNGQVQSHVFNARARNYSSSLEAALYPKNIETSVYHALIDAVSASIDALHRYTRLRKKLLGVEELHLYDMYVPLIPNVDIKMSYEEAEEAVIESVAPLGAEYQNTLKRGLAEHRWVDRFENENKRSGAYSSGCYDSMPYILMNYKGLLRDVFTLAHEAGHSMHSFLSHKNQPFHYSDYPIFVAEVASTFNEELLHNLLLKRFEKKEERAYLINQKIEDLRATLFRQTMFAEFELMIHDMTEKNVPLTPSALKVEYRKLNRKYFGEAVVIDAEIDNEWSRIPHFYYDFYVYQYATGISAAMSLSERVLSGGEQEREEYLSFLKGGCSQFPIDLLKQAGVDMRSPEPVKATIKKFSELVDQLEKEC